MEKRRWQKKCVHNNINNNKRSSYRVWTGIYTQSASPCYLFRMIPKFIINQIVLAQGIKKSLYIIKTNTFLIHKS